MKWSGRTYWLSRGLRSILTHMFKSLWWILMGNNHACPVLQSGTTEASDLLQGQRGLFLASEVIARQMALRQMFGIDWPRRAGAGGLRTLAPTPAFNRSSSPAANRTALRSRVSPPRFPASPPLPPLGWRGKIRAQQPLRTTKLHLKRHLLLLFTVAAHSFSFKDTQERKADWEMMNYLTMMSNCFRADILFLEGKGLGVRQCLWKGSVRLSLPRSGCANMTELKL